MPSAAAEALRPPAAANAGIAPARASLQERKAAEAAARKAEARRLLAEEEASINKKKERPEKVGKVSQRSAWGRGSSWRRGHSLALPAAALQPLWLSQPPLRTPLEPSLAQVTAHQLHLMKEAERKEAEKEAIERRLSDKRELTEDAHAAMVKGSPTLFSLFASVNAVQTFLCCSRCCHATAPCTVMRASPSPRHIVAAGGGGEREP